MRLVLEKAYRDKNLLEMIYMAKDGQITQRRIEVIQVGERTFRAYCYLRQSKRTFRIEDVLALVPVHHKYQAM
ncbi:transcriptional regulator [Sporosarcina sp. FSL W7-1349]|uniref:transcriptional regulator n=1 Tax=Sporosarcina sp. FSL W7-1349 TaxID=2921561 RepID=UPI0030F5350F